MSSPFLQANIHLSLAKDIMLLHLVVHQINPLYTGGLFHCYMLDESICHFRGVGSILLLSFSFGWNILSANTVDPGQMQHYVASDLDLHYLPVTFLLVSR